MLGPQAQKLHIMRLKLCNSCCNMFLENMLKDLWFLPCLLWNNINSFRFSFVLKDYVSWWDALFCLGVNIQSFMWSVRACFHVLENTFLRMPCVLEDYNFLASFHQLYLQNDSSPSDPESTPHISAFSECVLEQWRKGIFWLFPGILQVT